MADVIDLLEHDHREVEQIFSEYQSTADLGQQRALVDKAIIELVRHSEAEEQAVYPAIRRAIDGGDAIVDREISEHAAAERIMKELDGMGPEDPKFGVLMTQLITAISAHVADEEGNVFPKFRAAVDQDERDKLGQLVTALKKIVPTHPHPAAPDRPPWNALLAPGAALVDRVRDLLTGRGRKA